MRTPGNKVYELALILKSQVSDQCYYEDHVYLEQAQEILNQIEPKIKKEFLERICEALEHGPYAEFLQETFKDEVAGGNE